MRTISVLPSREVVESLARPDREQKLRTLLSFTEPPHARKHGGVFILSKSFIKSRERLQKKPFLRRWQSRQLSTQFKPDIMNSSVCSQQWSCQLASNDRKALEFRVVLPTALLRDNDEAQARCFQNWLVRFGLEMGFEGFLPNALRKNWPEGWQSCRQLGALRRTLCANE